MKSQLLGLQYRNQTNNSFKAYVFCNAMNDYKVFHLSLKDHLYESKDLYFASKGQ